MGHVEKVTFQIPLKHTMNSQFSPSRQIIPHSRWSYMKGQEVVTRFGMKSN